MHHFVLHRIRETKAEIHDMIDDAIKAVSQIFSPPLRAVLWKSILLALALIVMVGIGLDRLIIWLVGAGSASVETTRRFCVVTRAAP